MKKYFAIVMLMVCAGCSVGPEYNKISGYRVKCPVVTLGSTQKGSASLPWQAEARTDTLEIVVPSLEDIEPTLAQNGFGTRDRPCSNLTLEMISDSRS